MGIAHEESGEDQHFSNSIPRGSRLPLVGIGKLQEPFANEDQYHADLLAWETDLDRVYRKWSNGTALSEEEVRYLTNGLTDLYGTFEDLVNFARRSELDFSSNTAELRRALKADLPSKISSSDN